MAPNFESLGGVKITKNFKDAHCNLWPVWIEEGMRGNRVELVKNKLILCKIYSTLPPSLSI